MKSKLLLVLTLFVSSCYLFDSNLPFPKREYGPRVENSIAVTATKGFRKPGTHYVSRGTTVREFLEVAKMLPDPGFHSEGGWWSLKVAQLKNGSPGGFISREMPTEMQLDSILEDCAQVSVIKYNL